MVEELSWLCAPADRRFREALEAPFWTTLHSDITGRLWRALGRPSAYLAPLVCTCCALRQALLVRPLH